MTDDEFTAIEALSRRAAEKSLHVTGSHVDEDDRFDSLALHLLEVGVRAWDRFDPVAYADVRRETFAYRAMRGYRAGVFTEGPTIDWLRRTVRDRRFEPEIATVLTADGTIPEPHGTAHEPTLRFAIRSLGGRGVSERARDTLERLVEPMVVDVISITRAARQAGIPTAEAAARIEDLRRELVELGFRILPTVTREPVAALRRAGYPLELATAA